MEDETIIQLFWERSQDALGMIERKYGRLLRHAARNILGDARDAEEAVSDAYMRLWDSIPPERPRYLLAYAAKLSRNAALDALRRRRRQKRDERRDVLYSELDECLPAAGDAGERAEARELAALISRYLATLDAASRSLFVRRYFSMDGLDELAADFGLTKNAVSVRLHRVKDGLRDYLKKEGVTV